jgi:hypothetical protein
MKLLFMLTIGVLVSASAYTQGCIVNYVDPTFQLTKTDPTCAQNSGQIQVINQQGGVGPFEYRLIETNTVNTTGLFTGLAAGNYTISSTDACGTIRTRQATISPDNFDFTFSVSKLPGCSGGQISITPIPSGTYTYAVVTGTDTTRSNNPVFTFTNLSGQIKVLVTDECGNTKVKTWTPNRGFLPYISEIQYNLQCDKFDLFVVDYGFTSPTYCMYRDNGTLVNCQSTPNFFNVPYGNYYFIVSDACYRDSMYQPNKESHDGVQLDPYNWNCNTFTMHVDGFEDTVCLYNAITAQKTCLGQDTVSLNPRTGLRWPSGAVFTGLPYGTYYAFIYDPCSDSTWRADSTVVYPFNIFTGCIPACSPTESQVIMNFDPGTKSPYTIKIYHPDGTLVKSVTTTNLSNYIAFPAFPGGGTIKAIGIDACGYADTSYLQQQVAEINRSVKITNKCPGLIGDGGSGDIAVKSAIVPVIVKKNGIDVNIDYSTNASDTFNFPNLESSTYIIRYTFSCGSQVALYDTITINDYAYPTQPGISANQCGSNPFTFKDSVSGGLAPYTYQIISSVPDTPSIVTAVQLSPLFTIGTGTLYDSLRVRTVDVCGNSTIGNVNVLTIPDCDRVLPVDTTRFPSAINNKLAKVYPNPSDGRFIIAFSQKKKTNYKVQMMNTSGVKVFEQTLYNVDKKECVVSKQFMPGLYILTIVDITTGQLSTFKQIIR